MFRKILTIASSACIALATPAFAEPITVGSGDVGTSYTIDFDGFSGSSANTIDGLTSSLTLTLDSVSSTSYTFSYSLANTTSSPLTSTVSSFAFNTNPEIDSAGATGDFSFVTLDSSYPNQIGSVDVCFKAQGSGSCSNGGGTDAGDTGTGTLTLNFDQAVNSITLSDFFVRYQAITGAGNVTSASGQQVTSTSTSGGTDVPEPGMLGMFGLALLGLFFARRRKGVTGRQPRLALA
jgi:hypothetical protein